MQDEHVDLVVGYFKGAAWRQSSGNNPHPTSTLEEAFADTDFPMPLGSTLLCVDYFLLPRQSFIHAVSSADLLGLRALSSVLFGDAIALHHCLRKVCDGPSKSH